MRRLTILLSINLMILFPVFASNEASSSNSTKQDTVRYDNGDYYEGERFNDKCCGQGTHYWSDGTYNEDNWVNASVTVEELNFGRMDSDMRMSGVMTNVRNKVSTIFKGSLF